MRKYLSLIFICLPFLAGAQEKKDSLLNNIEYLDTVTVYQGHEINNYTLIGFTYGGVLNRMQVVPYQAQATYWNLGHYGFSITHYEKMFDYLPYFGFQVGINYSLEGQQFEYNKENGYTPYWDDGTERMLMRVIEIPVLAQLHFDAPPFKAMASAGFYGGYRKSIDRYGEYLDKEYYNKFHDYEKPFDYGLQGGVSFGVMFDPFEIHVGGMLRYSWGNLFEPDYASEYYYRSCYPLDVMITVGIYYQLTKRTGKTTGTLKREAKKIVYGE